jgi:GAF domain-containing protein
VTVERAAVDVARAVARGGAHARHDLISRVIGAVRRLDDASTLRGILDALADGVASETARVAMLLVDDEALRAHRHHGYDEPSAPVDLPLDRSPLLARVVASKHVATVRAEDAKRQPDAPAFMRVPEGRTGMASPLVLAGQVVAVLYVEGAARHESDPGEPVWTDEVELLVRHASARLENVTSKRTVEVLTGPS